MSKFTKLARHPILFFADAYKNKNKDKFLPMGKPDASRPNAYMIGFRDYKSSFFADEFQQRGYNTYSIGLSATALKQTSAEKLLGKTKFKPNDIVIIWGRKDPKGLQSYLKARSIELHRVEDAFIRSVDLTRIHIIPLSYIYDKTGIYFDSEQPSDLENLLATHDFAADTKLMDQAKRCIERMIKTRLSKYNFADKVDVSSLYGEKTRKRILVIGQVEDDASIEYGCKNKMTNNELVIRAQMENPDAQIIYKPHPDVLHGTRQPLSDPKQVESIATVLYQPLSITDALETIDHVYTMTSLSGMEALIRGIKVTTFGAPFYSGWGLTDDRQPVPRRTRTLSAEEVFAAAYILYPIYLNPFTKERIDGENALELLDWMRSNKIYPSEKNNDQAAQDLIKRSERAIRAGDYTAALRWADFAVNTNPTPKAYAQRAKANLKTGNVGREVEQDYKTACDLDGKRDTGLLLAYAKMLWEFKGYTTQLHDLVTELKTRRCGPEQRLVIAAMLNSGSYYQLAADLVSKNPEQEALGYIELASTLSKPEINVKLPSNRGADISNAVKKGTLNFAQTILDSKGDFCVVGNSPCETGSGNGSKIDAHKLIIRFNSFTTDYPFSQDYGTRTNIWVRMARDVDVTEQADPNIKQVIVNGGNLLHRMPNGILFFSRLLEHFDSVGVVPFDVYRRLVNVLGASPSGGLQILYWIYSLIGPIPRECVYGFQLIDQPKNRNLQYGTTNPRAVVHNWEKERAVFDSIVQNASEEKKIYSIHSSSHSSTKEKVNNAPGNEQNQPKSLMVQANLLWESKGFTKELNKLIESIKKSEKTSAENWLTLAAMHNSGGEYDRAAECAMRAYAENSACQYSGYIELKRTLLQMGLVEHKGTQRNPEEIVKLLKEGLCRFEQTILDVGKNFCVVGNSPRELGQGNGQRIDAKKIIIRFNSYSTYYPYTSDYGSRTDIWVRRPREQSIADYAHSSIKQVIVNGGNLPHRLQHGVPFFSRLMDEFDSVGIVPYGLYKQLRFKAGALPSAGLQMLYWIHSLIGPIPRDCVYGFELTDQPKRKDLQYNAISQETVPHDWEKEREIFDSLIEPEREHKIYNIKTASSLTETRTNERLV